MEFKKTKPPNLYKVIEVYNNSFYSIDNPDSKLWFNFLNKCGLQHVSMSRLKIVDHQKFFLARIKYGF